MAILIGQHANNPLDQHVLGVVQRIAGIGVACWAVWLASRADLRRRTPNEPWISNDPVLPA
jgi:hypothetical protein